MNRLRQILSSKSFWFCGLLTLGLLLRLLLLDLAELWYDEAFTKLLARLPFDRMIQATAGDTHPPLWYVLMWLWTRIGGESEAWLRLPAVILSLAAIPVAWRVTDRLGVSRNTQYALAVYMTISPFQVYFAQEARMYAALQLLVLIGVLAILERRWWLLGVANVLMLYLHNYGVFYVPLLVGLAALLAIRRQSIPILHVLSATVFPLVAWLPWAAVLLSQMHTVAGGYWIEPVSMGNVIYTLEIFLFGPFTRQFSLVAVLVTMGLLTWSLIQHAQRRTSWLGMAGLLAAGPFILAVLASLLWKPVYLFRGLIGAAPFLALIVIDPLTRLAGWRRLYVACILVAPLLAGMLGYWLDIAAFKSSTREVIDLIQSNWQEGDALYATNDGNWVMFSAYDQQVTLMPQCPDHADKGALTDLTRQALGVPIAEAWEVQHRRLWLLFNWGAPTSACNVERARLLIGERKPIWSDAPSDFSYAGVYLIEGGP